MEPKFYGLAAFKLAILAFGGLLLLHGGTVSPV
jgi:hypothetical protein